MDFTDKVVIVTGSSSGIGAATAKIFAKKGAKLTIVGRNEERLLEVATACQEANGLKPLCLLLDLTLDNSCEEVVRKTIETFGKLDVLVNSAGKVALTSIFDDNLEVGRNEERLLEVATACQEANGLKPLCLLLDLTLDNSCEEVVRKTIETFGKLDVLVNSAGKVALTSIFDDNLEGFDELVALNLRVPYKMSQLCIPHLKKTKGCIVNVFAAPIKVTPGFLVNSMMRDALERFTMSGGRELASEGVRMNAVRPGFTRTNILKNLDIEDKCLNSAYAKISKVVPSNVIIEPEEIARMILFAASDTCPNLNAASLIIDSAVSSQ